MSKSKNEFKVAVLGESMLTRPVSVYKDPDFLSVVKLFKDADVAINNVEGFGFTGFVGARVVGTGGTPMCGESWLAEEFKWMGFNLVSIANNHVCDYGEEGLLAGIKALDDVRLAHAGAGKDLWEARQPAYVETEKGRAAMVASSSAGLQIGSRSGLHTAATESGNGVPGRPGVNALRHDIIYTVTPKFFEAFKELNELWGREGAAVTEPLRPKIEGEEISFMGERVVVGDKPSIRYIPLKQDVEGNLRQIKNAKANASLVVATNHSHETDPALRSKWGTNSAEFIRKYAKDCIDAGADIFYGHGEHAGQGIEIYKGRPIFYSLANPIVQSPNIKRICLEECERYGLGPGTTIAEWMKRRREVGGGTWTHYPHERYMKAIAATFTMQDGEMTELKLYPVDSTFGEPEGTFVNRGTRPLMAKGKVAEEVIERYQGLSEPFGTEITFKDGIGIVKV